MKRIWSFVLISMTATHALGYIASFSEWLVHPSNKPGTRGAQEHSVIIFGDVHISGEASVTHYEWLRSLLEEFHAQQLPLTFFLEERAWDQTTTHFMQNTLPDISLFLRANTSRFRHLNHIAADYRKPALFWSSQFCIDLMTLIGELNYQWPASAWLDLEKIKEDLSSLYGPSPTLKKLEEEVEATRSQLSALAPASRLFPTFKKRLVRFEESWALIKKNFFNNHDFTVEQFFSTWLLGRKKSTFNTNEFRYLREFLKLDTYMVEVWFLAQHITQNNNNTAIWFVGQKHANALHKLLHDYERNRWATSVKQVGKTNRIRKAEDAKPLSLAQLNGLSLFQEKPVAHASIRHHRLINKAA